MSYAREARRFMLALMVAGLGILVTACESATAPEADLAAQLRDTDVAVDEAERRTDDAGRAGAGEDRADQVPISKHRVE